MFFFSVLASTAAIVSASSSEVYVPPVVSYNGLAATPQMGWNTWNTFGCQISEKTILNAAHALVSSGLKDVGYNHVLIDDCWHAPERESDGRPKAHPTKFSHGLRWLTDEIHALGLKAGIYSSAGTHTCGQQFGSLDYEEIDAQQYADWGFDYVKYDACFSASRYGTPSASFQRYEAFSKALAKTGREIFYSICNWGEDGVWNWGSTISNSWRMSGDITDNFNEERDDCPYMADGVHPPGYMCPVSNIVEKALKITQKSMRGSWADLDMLEVGKDGLTVDEQITHFTIWALLRSPLIAGNDITTMSETTRAILANKAIIAVSQESEGPGRPARRVKGGRGDIMIFKGDLERGNYVVAVSNFSDEDKTVDISLADVFRDDAPTLRHGSFKTDDLWSPRHFPVSLGLVTAFGANAIPAEGARHVLKGVQVRKHATRVWRFQLEDGGSKPVLRIQDEL